MSSLEGQVIDYEATLSDSTTPLLVTSEGKIVNDQAFVHNAAATINGVLTAKDKIVLTTKMYGTSFPSSPVEGQLFFKKV